MTDPEISYDLHDSVIVAVSTGPEQEVSFVIDLYPIFYPDKPRIVLRFDGILNYEKVRNYVKQIEAEADDDIGCGIHCFQYDSKKKSKAGDYWFFLETAWLGPVRIHCSQMTIKGVQHSSCEPPDAPEPERPGRQR